MVGALELKDRPIGELSGGQQQRVFLARALCSHTRLLLLDEPNTGLDVPSQNRFYELLDTSRRENGSTIMVVSHDLAMVSRYADRILCINKRLHVHGSPSEVLESPLLDQVYGCEFEAVSPRPAIVRRDPIDRDAVLRIYATGAGRRRDRRRPLLGRGLFRRPQEALVCRGGRLPLRPGRRRPRA